MPLSAGKPGPAEDTGLGRVTCRRLLPSAPPPPLVPGPAPSRVIARARSAEEGGRTHVARSVRLGKGGPGGQGRGRCTQQPQACGPPLGTLVFPSGVTLPPTPSGQPLIAEMPGL